MDDPVIRSGTVPLPLNPRRSLHQSTNGTSAIYRFPTESTPPVSTRGPTAPRRIGDEGPSAASERNRPSSRLQHAFDALVVPVDLRHDPPYPYERERGVNAGDAPRRTVGQGASRDMFTTDEGNRRTSSASYTVSSTSSTHSMHYSTRPVPPPRPPPSHLVHTHELFHRGRHVRNAASMNSISVPPVDFPLAPRRGSGPTSSHRKSSSLSLMRTTSNTPSTGSSDVPKTPAQRHQDDDDEDQVSATATRWKGKGRATEESGWADGWPVLAAQRGQTVQYLGHETDPSRALDGSSRLDLPLASSAPFVFPKPDPSPSLVTPTPVYPTSPVTSIANAPSAEPRLDSARAPRPEPATFSSFLPAFASPSKKSSRSSSHPRSKRRPSLPIRLRSRSRARRRPRSASSSSSSSSSSSRSVQSRRSYRSSLSTDDRLDPSHHRSTRRLSASVPNLRTHARSRSVPIPFETFTPRSPYAHARDLSKKGERGRTRNGSIADELMFGEELRRAQETRDRIDMGEGVFPSRRRSVAETEQGPKSRDVATPSTTAWAGLPVAASRERGGGQGTRGGRDGGRTTRSTFGVPPVPRGGPSRYSHYTLASPPPSRRAKPIIKGSLMSPHPKLVVSDPDGSSSDGNDDDDASVRRRYEMARRDSSLFDLDRNRGDDAESIDHSSVLRVLRENEESRREREAWSDSATKTLGGLGGLGLGFGSGNQRGGPERKRSQKGRGPGGLAFGGGRDRDSKVYREREQARRNVEKKKRSQAAESETEPEASATRAYPRRPKVPTDSPSVPHSFEPFATIGRRLSLSRTRSREKEARRKKPTAGGTDPLVPVPSASTDASAPRTVRGKPIRHLRSSPSVDSINLRTNGGASTTRPPTLPTFSFASDDVPSATQYGQALTLDDDETPNPPINAEHRRPSVTSQNAFLSLPPHLHHLLRTPERDPYTPSRHAPAVPSSLGYPNGPGRRDSKRLSSSSVASAARLSLALESHLLRKSQVDQLQQSGATLAQHDSNLATGQGQIDSDLPNGSPRRHHVQTLSPIPSSASPESKRSESSMSMSGSSESLNMDEGANWKKLFFSPPRKRVTTKAKAIGDVAGPAPHIASEDDAGAETDTTLEITLNRATGSAFDPAQAVPALPQPLERTDTSATEASSAQESFVTARENALTTPADSVESLDLPDLTEDLATTTLSGSSRPRPTPTQGSWAATSFAREYLGSDAVVPTLRTDAERFRLSPVPPIRSDSVGSTHSFIDIGHESSDDEGDGPSPRDMVKSPLSFMDDFSPPSSAPSSPHLASDAPFASFPTTDSLPASPTLSTTFDEADETSRYSRSSVNRDSHLSVGSHNLHISPTAARFVNRNSSKTDSFGSARSAALDDTIGSFPIPPVEEEDDAQSPDLSDVEDRQRTASMAEGDDVTLRLGSPVPTSMTSQRSSSVYAPTAEPQEELPQTTVASPTDEASFLDVSESSDHESHRLSGQSFRTFFYGPASLSEPPPLPRPS
ncbi:hypothetical protein JCM10212_001177 [Sporobolomyces blumeae]